ncbi:MAG: DnaA regulatory inactivator Hda [Gammaproteobacteria bacterium]|nr:DnaA regulatory inactivator Hda [Gammaproteobacteria bacterium]MDH5591971.1 DnaA regulatory inactivator Hda [Gammaproteobacteria bacterium]
MQSLASQLPLRLTPQELYRFDNFYFSQTELKRALIEFCRLETIDFLYLWGDNPSGKSHLLMATAEQVQQSQKRVLYLPLEELVTTASPEVLQSVEHLDLLCIDDLDAIAGRAEWEEAIFHCFNRLQHSGCKLLIAAVHNPAAIAVSLPDLRSRLATGLVYQLQTLDDDSKQQALIHQAQARGLELSEEVAQYLLRHHSRDMVILMALMQRLDKASMAAKRRLTIPFVRQVLLNG